MCICCALLLAPVLFILIWQTQGLKTFVDHNGKNNWWRWLKTPQTGVFCPSSWVCKVLGAESKLRPSFTRERKYLNSRTEGRHYATTGDKIFHMVLSSVHTNNSTNSNCDGTNSWETRLEWRWAWDATGSCCICREIVRKCFWDVVYQFGPPMLSKARSTIRPAAYDPCCRLQSDTRKSMGRHLHAVKSYYSSEVSF